MNSLEPINWSIEKAKAIYNISYWGDGYFDVNAAGEVEVVTQHQDQIYRGSFNQLIQALQQAELRLPVLVRFVDILKDRVQRLCQGFYQAQKSLGYEGSYTPVYPIKVNQQRRVVEEIMKAGEPHQLVGLEAGSKPELIAVLALTNPQNGLIVCNGYKDREYIRLALMGENLGSQVYIVIEKISELELILQEAKALGVAPRIGIRVRLAAVGKSNWQNTGGEKGKFGLSPSQLLTAVKLLKSHDQLACLQLLHVHIGSQVSAIEDIQRCMSEVARYYIELKKCGAPVQVVDLGGGLAVDYEGTASTSYYSMNYSMADYALSVLGPIKDACIAAGYPQPNIFTESGRALSAHHAVLITNIVDVEAPYEMQSAAPNPSMTNTAQSMWHCLQQVQHPLPGRDSVELYQRIGILLQESIIRFQQGVIDLSERALVESYYYAACRAIQQQLVPQLRAHRVILDELNDKLAERYFVNFSVFQSVPDVWGIDQVFPIIPLSGLAEEPQVRAKLHDITCDSDGTIKQYVDGMGLEATLPLPRYDARAPYYLGFFLVGAYQEILGDMHNLFGDTDAVDVQLVADHEFVLSHAYLGSGVDEVLRSVNYEKEDLMEALELRLQQGNIVEQERDMYRKELMEGLSGYTYWEPHE